MAMARRDPHRGVAVSGVRPELRLLPAVVSVSKRADVRFKVRDRGDGISKIGREAPIEFYVCPNCGDEGIATGPGIPLARSCHACGRQLVIQG